MARCTSLAVPYVRSESRTLALFLCASLFWMLFPGTLLAVAAVSGMRVPGGWVQAHGHAQLFGWVGTAILGVTLYAVPRLRRSRISSGLALLTWCVWNSGVAARWCAAMTAAERLLTTSAILELLAGAAVISTVAAARPSASGATARSLHLVWLSTSGLLTALLLNVFASVALAARSPMAQSWNARVITAFVWAAIVPSIFAYALRWIGPMLMLRREMTALTHAGVFLSFASVPLSELSSAAASTLRFVAVVLFAAGLRIFEAPAGEPKTSGASAHTLLFCRAPFAWLLLAGILDIAGVIASSRFISPSRHTLALGFIASIMLVVAQRFFPAFLGGRLYSVPLMTVSLGIHHLAVAARVGAELGAFERLSSGVVAASAVAELTAFLFLAINMAATMRHGAIRQVAFSNAFSV